MKILMWEIQKKKNFVTKRKETLIYTTDHSRA